MRKSGTITLVASLILLPAIVAGCSGSTPDPTPTPAPTATPAPVQSPTPVPTPTPLSIPMIDPDKSYTATIETEKGDLVLELFPADAPVTVSNFVSLARQGFYDDTTFHRVLPGFMAQGGDPTGTGAGGPGYFILDEFSERTHVTGALSMANSGAPGTGGSQFFITYEPKHYLDGRHTVFGQLVEGMDVLKSLTPRDPAQNPDFTGDRVIRVTIEES